jgi:flagellar motility protein MotE (MotC chaperone)
MEKKILYIGLATLFLVLISTLSLIILVINPNIFSSKINDQNKKIDTLTNSKGGDSNSLVKSDTNIIYDSLNYTISSLIFKRENLLFVDSTERLNKEIINKGFVIDSLKSENKKLKDEIDAKEKLMAKTGKTSTQSTFSEQEKKGYSKIYESMNPESAAKQLEEMPEIEAIKILLNIDSKQGAKILDKIEPKKAAKIWNTLNSKEKK